MGRDLLIRGGSTVATDGGVEASDVLVRDGVIDRIGASIDEPDCPVLDASDAYVLPGLINAHYHSAENFNPGSTRTFPSTSGSSTPTR